MSDKKKLRIVYFAGPGDVISTYQSWKEGEYDPSETNVTYSGQFYSVCNKLDIQAYVISSNPSSDVVRDERFIIEHRPNRLGKAGGLLYHIGQVKYGLNIIYTSLKFKADYVLISAGTHWFLLWPLSILGIKIIPTIHRVLWPKYKSRGRIKKCINFINGLFFKYAAYGVMSASKEITGQLDRSRVNNEKVYEFLPYYLESGFNTIKPPPMERKPFRVLFIGRIEKGKGVFDLLDAYDLLVKKGLMIELNYCGNGSGLDELKTLTKGNESIRCYGHCNREQLLSILESSHCVIAPTTTSFDEGFNQVVVESVLAGRPVVTSDVCPAIEYVRPAAVECEPDNIMSYAEGIEKLYLDQDFYFSKRDACNLLQQKFYDEKNSWGSVLQEILKLDNKASRLG